MFILTSVHAVIGNNSTITINIKENVALSCMEPATVVPQSGVVWIKNGTKLSENVRVICKACEI